MIECLKFGTTKEGNEASIYILENDSILVPKFAKKSEVILEKDKQLTNQQ